ncbi:class I SAM-dependent methyltransferase [bacterium]|nr:class I SAM-dependent methyltransferase [bacterium]
MTRESPRSWAEGDHLPWDDPGFSERALKEHLSQKHDGASRRFEKIDRHVRWIHRRLLGGQPSRILDLGCGPGLYLQRLARLGHDCTGIDFSPASIAYARDAAEQAGWAIRYVDQDIREAEFGADLNLVMLIWGEFNGFSPPDARRLLLKCVAALRPGGELLLEPSTLDSIQRRGLEPTSRHSSCSGLFLDSPHDYLQENFWDASCRVATTRWTVTDAVTGRVTIHAASYQAYTDEDYQGLLKDCGFATVRKFASLTGHEDDQSRDLLVLIAGR